MCLRDGHYCHHPTVYYLQDTELNHVNPDSRQNGKAAILALPATTLNGPNARHHLRWALNSTAYAWYLSITNTCLCLPASLDVPVRSVKEQNPSGLSTNTTHHHRNWAFVIKWACHLASHRPNDSGTARCNAVVSIYASYAEVRSSCLRYISVSVGYCCVPFRCRSKQMLA